MSKNTLKNGGFGGDISGGFGGGFCADNSSAGDFGGDFGGGSGGAGDFGGASELGGGFDGFGNSDKTTATAPTNEISLDDKSSATAPTNEISLDDKNSATATNEIPKQARVMNELTILREQGEQAKSVAKSLNGSLPREDSNAGALPTVTNEIRQTSAINTQIAATAKTTQITNKRNLYSTLSADVRGMLLVFVGGVFWGFSGACGEYIFLHKGASADFLVPYRLFFAGAFILIYYLLTKRGLDLRIFRSPRHLASLLVYAFFGILMTQYTYFYGIELSNAAIATVIQYTAPIFIVLYVCHTQRRAPSAIETCALACVMLGTTLLATNGDFSALVLSPYALGVCFLSAIGTVVYNLAPTTINRVYDPVLNLGYAMIITGMCLCIYNDVLSMDVYIDMQLVLAMLGVIVFGTIFAFGFYMLGLRQIGASKASLISSVEPISAACFSAGWIGTRYGLWQMVGFGLIMGAILLIYFAKGQR